MTRRWRKWSKWYNARAKITRILWNQEGAKSVRTGAPGGCEPMALRSALRLLARAATGAVLVP